jgi:SNF2 family DNA or RNA helicase
MLLREGMPVLLPETLKDLAAMNGTDTPIVQVEPPESVAGALRDYQKSAFEWLCFLDKFRFGGVLADEMGLGKTLEILCFLRSIRGRGVSIIICPSSLVYNWAAEIG